MKYILVVMLTLTLSSCASYDPSTTIQKFENLKVSIYETPITDEVNTKENIDTFIKEICNNVKNDECTKKFNDMFFARLEKFYPLVNWAILNTDCKAYPMDCKDHFSIEIMVIKSHNRTVENEKQRSIAQEEVDFDAKKRAGWAAFGQAMQQQNQQMQQQQRHDQMMQQLNKPVQTNCYTSFGSTRCTSY